MTLFEISDGERARWQRRAARELAAMLDTHPDLPVIAWTVGSAGSVLVGHVSGLAATDNVREMFHAWRLALPLGEHVENTSSSSGFTYLWAADRRNRVGVTLTATVFDDTDGQASR